MEIISAGEVFRTLAKERGMTLAEFGELAEKDDSIDVQIDKRQQEIAATRDNIILEGRLAGHMAATRSQSVDKSARRSACAEDRWP